MTPLTSTIASAMMSYQSNGKVTNARERVEKSHPLWEGGGREVSALPQDPGPLLFLYQSSVKFV